MRDGSNRPKLLNIVTFASEKTLEFSKYSLAINRLYSRMWNISFLCFDETTQNGAFDLEKVDRRWNKVGILRKLLSANIKSGGSTDEYFIWMDADMIVLNFDDLDFHAIIEQYQSADFIVSSEWHAESGVANTGCFIVRRTVFSHYLIDQWWQRYDHWLGHDQTFFSVMYRQLLRASAQCSSNATSNLVEFDCTIIGTSVGKRIAIIPGNVLNSHPQPALRQQTTDNVLHLMGESARMRADVFRAAAEEIARSLGVQGDSSPKLFPDLLPQLGLDRPSLFQKMFTVLDAQRVELMTLLSLRNNSIDQEFGRSIDLCDYEHNRDCDVLIMMMSRLRQLLETVVDCREKILQLTSYIDQASGNADVVPDQVWSQIFLRDLQSMYSLLHQATGVCENAVKSVCLLSKADIAALKSTEFAETSSAHTQLCVQCEKVLQRLYHTCVVIGNDLLSQISLGKRCFAHGTAATAAEVKAEAERETIEATLLFGEVLSMLLRRRRIDATAGSSRDVDEMIGQHLGNMAAFQLHSALNITATAFSENEQMVFPATTTGVLSTLMAAVETLMGIGGLGIKYNCTHAGNTKVEPVQDLQIQHCRLNHIHLQLLDMVSCMEEGGGDDHANLSMSALSPKRKCDKPSFQLISPVTALASRLMEMHMTAVQAPQLEAACLRSNQSNVTEECNAKRSNTLIYYSLMLFGSARRYQQVMLMYEHQLKQDHLLYAHTLIQSCRYAVDATDGELALCRNKSISSRKRCTDRTVHSKQAAALTEFLSETFAYLRVLHQLILDKFSAVSIVWLKEYQRLYGTAFEDDYSQLKRAVESMPALLREFTPDATTSWGDTSGTVVIDRLTVERLREMAPSLALVVDGIENNVSHIAESIRQLSRELRESRSRDRFETHAAVIRLLDQVADTEKAVFSHLHRRLLGISNANLGYSPSSSHFGTNSVSSSSSSSPLITRELLDFAASFTTLYRFCEPLLELATILCELEDSVLNFRADLDIGAVNHDDVGWNSRASASEVYSVLFDVSHSQQKLQQIQRQENLWAARYANDFVVRVHSKLLLQSAQCYYASLVDISSSQTQFDVVRTQTAVDRSSAVAAADTLMGWIHEQIGLMHAVVGSHSDRLRSEELSLFVSELSALRDRLVFHLCPVLRHMSESLNEVCHRLAA